MDHNFFQIKNTDNQLQLYSQLTRKEGKKNTQSVMSMKFYIFSYANLQPY